MGAVNSPNLKVTAGVLFQIDANKCVACSACLRACPVDAVGVEVTGIGEYMGGQERIPESRIITIEVPYEVGSTKKTIDPFPIPPKDHRIINIRLQPTGRLSSYLLRLTLYSRDQVMETELIAADF